MTGEKLEKINEVNKKLTTGAKVKVGIKKFLVKVGGKLIIIASFVVVLILLFLVITFISISAVYVNEMDGTCVEADEFGSSSKIVRATAQSEDDFTLKQNPKYEEVTEKIRLTDLKLTLNNDPIIINISGKWLPWRTGSNINPNSDFSKKSIFKNPNESFICMLEKAKLPEDTRYSSKEEENEFYYIKNYYNDFIVNKIDKNEIKVIGVPEAPERQKNCWVTRGAGLYLGMFGTTGRSQPTAYHHLIASKMMCAKSYWFGKNINNNDKYVITKYYEPAKQGDKNSQKLRLNKIDGSLRTLFTQEEGGYTRGAEYYKLLEYKKIAEDYIIDLKDNYESVFKNKSQENLMDNYNKESEQISDKNINAEDSTVYVPLNMFRQLLTEINNFINKMNEDYKYDIKQIENELIVNAGLSSTMEKEKFNADLERILESDPEFKCEIPTRKDANGNDVKDSNGEIIKECPCNIKLSNTTDRCPTEQLKTCCAIKYNEDLKVLQYIMDNGEEVKETIRNNVVALSIIIKDKLNQIIQKINKDIEIMENNEATIDYKDNAESQKINFVEKEYLLADFKKDYFTLESYGVSSEVGTESSKILTIEGNQVIYDIDLHEKLLYSNGKVKNPAEVIANSISMFDKACYFIDKDLKGDIVRKNRAYFQYGPKTLYKHFSENDDIKYEYGERIKMLIADKYYSDNDGFYNIEIISGISFDDTGTIASKLKEIEFYLLGTPLPGEEDDRADGMIARIFNNLLNTGFAKFARAAMTLYVVIFGFRVIFGFKKNNRDKTPIKMSDLMIDLAKMVMVVIIISPSGFQFFNKIVLNFTINGVIGIVDILSGVFFSSFMSNDNFIALSGGLARANEVLSLSRNFKVIDEVLALFKTDVVMLKIFSLFYNFKKDFFAGIPIGFGVLIIIIMYLFKLFKTIIPFFFTLIQMTLVLPLAPLFLLFNFFEQTQYLFKNWMKFVLQKCLEIIAFFTAFYFMTFIINDFIKKLLSFKVCFGRLGDHICETTWNGNCGGRHFIRKIIVSMFNCIIYMEKENMPNGNTSFFKYYMSNILICLVLLILFEEITKMITDILGSTLSIDDATASGLGGNSTMGDFAGKNQDGSSKFGSLADFTKNMGLAEMQKNSDALKWTRSFIDIGKSPAENLKDLGKKAYNVYKAGGEARIDAMQERIDDKARDDLNENRSIGEKWEDFKKRREKYHNSVREKKEKNRKEVMEKDFAEFNDSFGRESMFDAIGFFRGEHKRFWKQNSKWNLPARFNNWVTEGSLKYKNKAKDFLLGINKSAAKKEKAALRNQGYYVATDKDGNLIKMSLKDGTEVYRNGNGDEIKYSLYDKDGNESEIYRNKDGDIKIDDDITVKEDGSCILNIGEVEYLIKNENSNYVIYNKDGSNIIDGGEEYDSIINSIKKNDPDANKKSDKEIIEEKMEKVNKKIEKFKKMEEEQKKLDEKKD